MTEAEIYERACRILRLTDPPRSMTHRAAAVVIDAAMFGMGCLEGEMREKIQKELASKGSKE